jgi:hypothetical protein
VRDFFLLNKLRGNPYRVILLDVTVLIDRDRAEEPAVPVHSYLVPAHNS